jgi:GNAT superfamily N-acetyltransferase
VRTPDDGIRFRRLVGQDAGEQLVVQLSAFIAEARTYGTLEIPPLVETVDDMVREIESTVTTAAFRRHRMVGAARLTIDGEVGWISRVAVVPDEQGRGIGSALVEEVERSAPAGVRTFKLAAGTLSGGNLALYERLGYHAVDSLVDSAGVHLVVMAKARSG